MRNAEPVMKLRQVHNLARRDRKSTRLNSSQPCNLVCRLLLEKKNAKYGNYSFNPGKATSILTADGYKKDSNGIMAKFFFFNDTGTTEIYTFSLHDASSD